MKLLIILLLFPFILSGAFFHKGIEKTYEKRSVKIQFSFKNEKNIKAAYILVRKLDKRKYKKIKMKRKKNGFVGEIYAKFASLPGFEYFIVAKQGKHVVNVFNNKWEPQTVRVLKVDRSKMTQKEKRKELFIEENKSKDSVISASRSTQKITEAPSTITVITAKDIENMGVSSLPEVFRSIPGMDVARISPSDANISIRGFNREGSNKVLALIDGRPIYMDLFGITFWDILPIGIEDIEKIEIIRGPGSTLYGANAFNGVISIFTKNPDKESGGHISSTMGPYGFSETIYAMGNEDLYSYRVSSGFKRTNSFENTEDNVMQNVRANGSFYMNSDDEKEKLSIHTGFVKGNLDSLFSLIGSFKINNYNHIYAQTVYENSGFKFNLIYDFTDVQTQGGFPSPKSIYTYKENRNGTNTAEDYKQIDLVKLGEDLANIGFNLRELNNPIIVGRTHKIEAELQYQKDFGKDIFLTGLNYKYSTLDATGLLDNDFSQHLLGIYAQNELKLGSFIFNIGIRGDFLDTKENIIGTNKEVGNIFSISPRGSIVFIANDSNVFRFSAGRAFRNPTYLESNMRINLLKKEYDDNGNVVDPGIDFNGTQDARPEKITSFELAYSLDTLDSKLKFNINLFYNKVEDLILFRGDFSALLKVLTSQEVLERDLFNFNNDVDADNFGGEISFSWYINQYFSFFINYSYQKTFITNEDYLKKKYAVDDVHKITTVDTENPEHKANIGLNFVFSDLYLNIFAHYVSASERGNFITDLKDTKDDNNQDVPWPLGEDGEVIAMEANASTYNKITHWVTLNINLKYTLFNDKLTIGFIGEDLLAASDTVYKHTDSLYNDSTKIGYSDSIKAPTGISGGRHIEYPRSYLFGDIIGGETMGRRFYGYLKFKF